MAKLLVLMLGITLAGCAAKPSVSEYQCMAGDWQTIGMRDGAQGRATTALLSHQEACGAYGVVPDRVAYNRGWQQGIAQFCTVDNGFELGQRGARRNSICVDPSFQQAFREGKELYHARREVAEFEQQIIELEARIPQIKQEIIGATTAQLQPMLTAQERVMLVAKVQALIEERDALHDTLPYLEQNLVVSQARLDELLYSMNLVSQRN